MEQEYEPDENTLIEEHLHNLRNPAKPPSKLKGRKCEPKYRGPNGETWSGRGKLPKFIRDSGQDKEAFRIVS